MYYLEIFSRELKKIKIGSTIWIIDIDNTVADTWQTFHSKWSSEKERLSNIPILQGSVDYINSKKEKEDMIIYLSARNYFTFDTTYNWLKKYELVQTEKQLYLVAFPEEKTIFIKKALKNNVKVVYMDDLSHSHELGEAKFYLEVIENIKTLPITYVDYDYILKLNKK